MNILEISDPEKTFHVYSDTNDKEWLGVDIAGYDLGTYAVVWITTYRPKRPGYRSSYPPPGIDDDNSLKLSYSVHIMRKESSLTQFQNTDFETVQFGVDIHDIGILTRDLSKIRFLLIPCAALEKTKVLGFEGGCTP